MSAIPRPVTASSYLKHHTDLAYSSRHNSYSTSPLALHQVSSPLQNMSSLMTPASNQLLRPLSPVERALHGFQHEFSGSSSYNSTESLVSVLGHQSYDSDQCHSPKGDIGNPGNNGDSNNRKTFDYPSSYVQSPLAKSSPFEKLPSRDRVMDVVDADNIMFGDSKERANNRSDLEQVDNNNSEEQKLQQSLVSQLKQSKEIVEVRDRGDDAFNHNEYSNQDDYVVSMTKSLSANKPKQCRSKNRQHGKYANVISEPLNGEKDKILTGNSLTELENSDPLQLTAWEQWMLRKAKQEREKRLAEVKRVAKAKAQLVKAAKEKDEKNKRTQEQLSQWCLKKRIDNDLKKLKKRQDELMAEQQRRQKEEAEQRAEENFRLWLAAKAQLTREAKQREKDRREKQEEEQRQRRKMSTVEFEKWCQKVENRSRRRHGSVSSSNSKNHVAGGIVNLRDAEFEKAVPFAEPEPSFYNPIPWQPTVIPSPKTNKRCHPCRSRYLTRAKCW